jgi:hypothetical protein
MVLLQKINISHFRRAEPAGENRGKMVLTVILPDESRYILIADSISSYSIFCYSVHCLKHYFISQISNFRYKKITDTALFK